MTKHYYRQVWIAAAAVAFALFAITAFLSGQDMPPSPPILPKEHIIQQKPAPYMLLSPRQKGDTDNAAMTVLVWDYSIPVGSTNPILRSPKGAETLSVAMVSLAPFLPLTLVSQTCFIWYTNLSTTNLGEVAIIHVWANNGEQIQFSDDMQGWTNVTPDNTTVSDIVGYIPEGDTNAPKKTFFRAVPQ